MSPGPCEHGLRPLSPQADVAMQLKRSRDPDGFCHGRTEKYQDIFAGREIRPTDSDPVRSQQ